MKHRPFSYHYFNPAFAGALVFVILALLALLCPLITSYDPLEMKISERLSAPDSRHLMGTDEFGRDLFTRILYGSRLSLGVGFAVTFLTAVAGLTIGVYASYYRALDQVFMRICDGLSAIPGILLAIAFMIALGASAVHVIFALTIVYTPAVARVVRSRALVIKNMAFIETLQAQGARDRRIIWLHIAPNVLSPLFVQVAFVFASAILSEASLSFLGAGIPAPAPSWGGILQAGKPVIAKAWWMIVFPGIMVILSVLSLTLLGDGLRDMLDPQNARKRNGYGK